MRLLCEVTDMNKVVISVGKFQGNNSYFKWAVMADNYNWILGKILYDENNNYKRYNALKYYPSFHLLLKRLSEVQSELNHNIDENKAFETIKKTLEENTKKQYSFDINQLKDYGPTSTGELNIAQKGRSIDILYNCIFSKEDNDCKEIIKKIKPLDLDENED